MKIVEWSPKYSVSIKSIDDDHVKLFNILNKLFESISKGEAKSIIFDIIYELEQYSNFHFNREETFFRQTNYPESVEHVKEHEAFKQKIQEIKKEVSDNKSIAIPELLGFLSSWLKDRIANSDKAYEEHFKKHGVV